MEPPKYFGVVITAILFLVAVCADPDCQVFEEKDVICTSGNEDYVLRRGLVSDITQATRITLRNCRITDIEDSLAFENVYYLQYIDLSENKLSSLKPGVLNGNGLVKHLNLSHNLLTTIPGDLFVQKPNLEVLDLKANRLNSLPSDVFVPLRKLKHIDLSYNDFLGKDISSYLFTKTRKINFMDLSKNDMSDTPENLLNTLQEIHFLNLDRCSLKNVPQFATKANMRTMTHLSLSTNQITNINQPRTFMNLENLIILNMAENLIENVAANAFIFLKNVQEINLRNNRLKTLPDGFFRNLANLRNVDLSHNLIEHVPLNSFRGTALQELYLSSNRFSYLDAYFCVQLKNAGTRISKLYVDDNPWQCACLNEIINEMKTYGVKYNYDKYNGQHAVCVTTETLICKRHELDNQQFVELYDNIIKGKKSFV